MSSSSRDCKPTFNGKSTCSIVKSSTIHGFATAMLVYQQVLGMLESSTICLEIVWKAFPQETDSAKGTFFSITTPTAPTMHPSRTTKKNHTRLNISTCVKTWLEDGRAGVRDSKVSLEFCDPRQDPLHSSSRSPLQNSVALAMSSSRRDWSKHVFPENFPGFEYLTIVQAFLGLCAHEHLHALRWILFTATANLLCKSCSGLRHMKAVSNLRWPLCALWGFMSFLTRLSSTKCIHLATCARTFGIHTKTSGGKQHSCKLKIREEKKDWTALWNLRSFQRADALKGSSVHFVYKWDATQLPSHCMEVHIRKHSAWSSGWTFANHDCDSLVSASQEGLCGLAKGIDRWSTFHERCNRLFTPIATENKLVSTASHKDRHQRAAVTRFFVAPHGCTRGARLLFWPVKSLPERLTHFSSFFPKALAKVTVKNGEAPPKLYKGLHRVPTRKLHNSWYKRDNTAQEQRE